VHDDLSNPEGVKPETKTELDRAGGGRPPGRTAIGLGEPESKPIGWFRRFLNWLLRQVLGDHPEIEDSDK